MVVFHRQIDPCQHLPFAVQRGVHVQRGAIAVPTAGAGLQGGERVGLGFLGDDIHRAAGIAAPVQAGGGAFEHFDAFEIGGIRRARVTAVGAEAVLVELRRSEAAHAVFIEGEAAEVVLLGDAAGKFQGAFHVGAAQVLEHVGGNHADGLRDVAQRGVGLGCAGGAGGAIAVDRAGGGFVGVGGDADGVQFNAGVFGAGGVQQQTQGQAGQRGKRARRHDRAFQWRY